MRTKRRRYPAPVVNSLAAKSYLGRALENHDWVKEVPAVELAEHARELGYRFVTDCWHNQLACFALGAAHPGFLFFLKMGGGKSKIVLDQIRYRKRRGEIGRALILAPELVHIASWEEQMRQHAPDLRYRLLLGSREERFAQIERPADVCLMNYKGLEVYMSKLTKPEGKRRAEQRLDPKLASEFAARFNFLAFDESHKLLGSHRSLVFDLCRWLSVAADFRYALTGSPFGRDPTPLWSQFMLVDHGATLGSTLGPFRNAFFEPRPDYWKPGGFALHFRKELSPELNRIIKHRSITYELAELRDMPAKVPIRIPVRMTSEGWGYYSRIIQKLQEASGDYRSLGNLFVRMRQCASGFLAMKADDESRIEVRLKVNPKLDALRDLLLSKPEEKFLVYHDFRISGQIIEEMLAASKIGYASIRGGIKNPAAEYARFLRDKSCRAFVLNNAVGSEAINPQYVCRRLVFYESPVDPKQREQAEGRVHRPGQKWPTFIYDLMVERTVEVKIRAFIGEGRDLLKAVLSGDIGGLDLGPDKEDAE